MVFKSEENNHPGREGRGRDLKKMVVGKVRTGDARVGKGEGCDEQRLSFLPPRFLPATECCAHSRGKAGANCEKLRRWRGNISVVCVHHLRLSFCRAFLELAKGCFIWYEF